MAIPSYISVPVDPRVLESLESDKIGSFNIDQNIKKLYYWDKITGTLYTQARYLEYIDENHNSYIVWAKPAQLYIQQSVGVTSMTVTRTWSELSSWSGPEVLTTNPGGARLFDVSYGDEIVAEITVDNYYEFTDSSWTQDEVDEQKFTKTLVVTTDNPSISPQPSAYQAPANITIIPEINQWDENIGMTATNLNNEELLCCLHIVSMWYHDDAHSRDIAVDNIDGAPFSISANSTTTEYRCYWLGDQGGKIYSYYFEIYFKRKINNQWVECSPRSVVTSYQESSNN